MEPKKYNYDEPIDTSAGSVNELNEPALAYSYGNQGTHIYTPEPTKPVREQKILQPDADFYRAISMDEFRQKVLVMVDKLDKKYGRKN